MTGAQSRALQHAQRPGPGVTSHPVELYSSVNSSGAHRLHEVPPPGPNVPGTQRQSSSSTPPSSAAE
eukprot:3416083-Rhodomonas_salina.2